MSFYKQMLLILDGINSLKAEDSLKLPNFTASQYSALGGALPAALVTGSLEAETLCLCPS